MTDEQVKLGRSTGEVGIGEKANADDPEIVVKDRRFWADGEEDGDDDGEEYKGPRKPTYIEQLEETMEKKDRQLQEYIRAHKQVEAEQEAFRQRLSREQELRVDQEVVRVLKGLLDTLDNLERSIEVAKSEGQVGSLLEGVCLVRNQFSDSLSKIGVVKMESLGETFDPNRHEALQMMPVDVDRDNMVMEEVRPGYTYKDKLLRSAQVIVGRAT